MKTTKALVGILAAFFLSSCVDSITETSSPGDAGTLTLAPRIVADGETELRGDKFELILTSGGRPVSKIDTLYSLVKGQRLVLGAVNIGDTFTIVARAYDTLPQKGRAYTWSGTFHGKAAGVTTTVQSDTIRVAAGPPLKVDTASGIFVPKGSYYTTDGKDPRDTASHATQASKDTILPKSGPIKFAKDTTIDGIKVWSLFSREYPIDPKLAFVGEWWEEWKDSGNRMITKWTLNSNGSFSYVDCDTVNFSTISGSVTGNWSANDTTFSYTHTKTTTAKILNASSDTFQL
ncbi:MAG: hypothetical protein RL318_2367, partial [Fibrobacterota bacterium]